ncbi:MAG: glycosyltransferase, partial [Patescibacteria group bacterium]
QNVFTKRNINGEIVLINDASKDNTGEIIDKFAKQFQNVTACHHKENKRMVGGWKTGLAASQGEYVCLIDSDLQNLPEDVGRLYREIKITRADMVQGFRSSIGRARNLSFFLSKGLNFLLNFLFSMSQKDNKCGFVICRREVLEDILRYRYKYRYFQTFITVAAKAKGYTIREIETLFEKRRLGKSFIPKLPIKVVVLALWDLVKGLFEFRFISKKETILKEFILENPSSKYQETLIGWRRHFFNIYMACMPLHHWMISRDSKIYYQELKKSQWLSLDQIKKLQELKLRKLIHHSYHHVAFYREIFDKLGIKPSDIQTIEDLQKLPFLDKKTIRQNLYFDLMSDNHNKKEILKITTSGSTGEPLVCYADKYQLEKRWAATQRSMEWTGYRFGDRQTRFWHQTIGMSRLQIIKERLDAWFNRRLFIPVFEMSDESIKNYLYKVQRFKPILIDGYAEAFNFLAHYVKNHKLKGFRPKAILSSAQALPDHSRQIIEQEFGCGIFDKYGSREFSGIAYECEAHDGHHIVAENYIVEILKDGRPAQPGEMGEVVITDLDNYCMPFIRYRIGDLAVAMDNTILCACGRGLPRIGKIEGRVQSIIFGANNNYVPSSLFGHWFKDYDHIINQYQVVQEELGKVDLKIVKAVSFDEDLFRGSLSKLSNFLGNNTIINVNFVDDIPMVRTGKHQVSVSKIDIDFQDIGSKFKKEIK